ncbi:S-layer homology domain-containing protein [Flavonifractor plautii]
MPWAYAGGLISGTGPATLKPGGGATRAQAAAILVRFCTGAA